MGTATARTAGTAQIKRTNEVKVSLFEHLEGGVQIQFKHQTCVQRVIWRRGLRTGGNTLQNQRIRRDDLRQSRPKEECSIYKTYMHTTVYYSHDPRLPPSLEPCEIGGSVHMLPDWRS